MLIYLPQDIWRERIARFVTLHELVRLDSAVVNRNDRETFLSNIGGLHQFPCYTQRESQSAEMEWRCRRLILPVLATFSGCCAGFDERLRTFFSRSRDLNFEDCFFADDESLSQLIQWCTEMNYLSISSCTLPTSWCLNDAKKMSYLSISSCHNITDEMLSQNLAANTIRDFRITDCSNITSSGIAAAVSGYTELCLLEVSIENCCLGTVLEALPNPALLQSLIVGSKCSLDRALFQSISTTVTNVTSLIIMVCNSVTTDSDIECLVSACSHITCLSLGAFKLITDAALVSIGTHLPKLKSFTLESNSLVTDAGVVALAERCADLGSLRLYKLRRITDASLQAVGTSGRKLGSLNVAWCVQVTDSAFTTFKEHGLSCLDVSGTAVNGSFLKAWFRKDELCSLMCNYCANIICDQFLDGVSRLTGIYTLQLCGTPFPRDALLALSLLVPTLMFLNVARSMEVDEVVVRSFVLHNPQLHSLDAQECGLSEDLKKEFKCLRL